MTTIVKSIEDCVEKDTFHLADVVKGAQYGFSGSNDSHSSSKSSLFLTQDLTAANMGKHFTVNSQKALLTSSPDDMLITFLDRNLSFAIFVHDENFFLVNMNPLGPPSNMLIFKQPFGNFYLDSSCKM